jgi:hypothetical protein
MARERIFFFECLCADSHPVTAAVGAFEQTAEARPGVDDAAVIGASGDAGNFIALEVVLSDRPLRTLFAAAKNSIDRADEKILHLRPRTRPAICTAL